MCSDESDGTRCTFNSRRKGRTRSYHLATWPTYSGVELMRRSQCGPSGSIESGPLPKTPVTRMLSHSLMRWLRGWVSNQKGGW